MSMQQQHIQPTLIAMVLALSPWSANADEAESFDISVKGNGTDIQLTYTDQNDNEYQDAMDFTVHDPQYGSVMLCNGTDGKYKAHSHTKNGKSGAINFDHDYKHDHRNACTDVSSVIKRPYWVMNLSPIFYYDTMGSLRGCQLSGLPNAYGQYNRVKYDLLPDSHPLYNKTGMPLSAVYVDSDIGFELDKTTEEILNVGDVDDGNDLPGIDSGIDKSLSAQSFNCDPRVGDNITLKNMATYSVDLSHTINFGYNVSGVELVEPGAQDYPAYRIQVTNNTGSEIDLINTSAAGSYLEYCENTTPLDTVGYVFKEAGRWVAAGLKSANGTTGNYTIEKVNEEMENEVLDKAAHDKTKPIFSDCNDGTAAQKRDFFAVGTKITLSAGETKDITQMFVLNNFDNFYDISLSYQVLGGGNPTYTYNLSPTKAYKPITFNSGFHDITITLDGSDQAQVEAQTDILFSIVNVLNGGKNND